MKINNETKIIIFSAITGLLILSIASFFNSPSSVQSVKNISATYGLAAFVPLSGQGDGAIFGTGNLDDETSLSKLLDEAFLWGVAITIILAVLFVIIGSVQYMTTDAVFGQKEAKKKIASAISGLILALVSWLILTTINPALKNNALNFSTPVLTSPIHGGFAPAITAPAITAPDITDLQKPGATFEDSSGNIVIVGPRMTSAQLNQLNQAEFEAYLNSPSNPSLTQEQISELDQTHYQIYTNDLRHKSLNP
ncbi:MAG: pilin [bacterium]|nr:pilin [bacterium]